MVVFNIKDKIYYLTMQENAQYYTKNENPGFKVLYVPKAFTITKIKH